MFLGSLSPSTGATKEAVKNTNEEPESYKESGPINRPSSLFNTHGNWEGRLSEAGIKRIINHNGKLDMEDIKRLLEEGKESGEWSHSQDP